MPSQPPQFCVVVASNHEVTLQHNLLTSPMIATGQVEIHIERNAPSASIAYNRGLAATSAPFIIIAHQDVYFPPGWNQKLAQKISELNYLDPDWALLSPFGMSMDGQHMGPVWSTSLGQIIGQHTKGFQPVQSFDEMVLVLRRDSGVSFDENLPGFHMYGTDIVQIAGACKKTAYVTALPMVHNDVFHDNLHADFAIGYHFIRQKWHQNLPLRNPVLWITKSGIALFIQRLKMRKSRLQRQAITMDTTKSPRHYSMLCGWE